MKKLLLFIAIFTISTISYSQIGVGPNESVKYRSGTFSKESIERLKATNTIFVCKESDNIEELQLAIEEVWKITEISFIKYSELNTIDLEESSIFKIGIQTISKTQSSGFTSNNILTYLNLSLQDENNKKESYCRIELSQSIEDLTQLLKLNSDEENIDYLYSKGGLHNWNVGFLKTYLKKVNDLIMNEEERWLNLSNDKNSEIKQLASITLYIPEYATLEFKRGVSSMQDETELFKSYSYNYKIINTNDLSKMILESEEPIYYLAYVKSGSNKYVTIMNSKTAAIIYSKAFQGAYRLKSKDLKSISKTIKAFRNK